MSHRLPLHLLAIAACAVSPAAALSQGCSVRSGPDAATVVELYTSEGCSSCPSADRWLSSLPAQPGLVALAFHVDYWDHLGWKDRFASPAYTQRQSEQRSVSGARYSYTPQVVVDGRDRQDWRSMRWPAAPSATVDITLERSGGQVNATVRSHAARSLAAFWAVTESGHSSAVRAGENRGATLAHDHVVRHLQPVPAWAAEAGGTFTLRFDERPATPANHPRRFNLVVTDARTGRPLQAAWLGC